MANGSYDASVRAPDTFTMWVARVLPHRAQLNALTNGDVHTK
jgi:hypothetical protein